ncbi:MAG: FecR family protein, partial [Fimbriimonadaceae bacterium]|nr:FecR family protein [Alphaproteobacteria bacterium]
MVGSGGPDSYAGLNWHEGDDGLISINGNNSEIIEIPDARLMFSGEYSRMGNDLLITGESAAKIIVTDYFNHDDLATLSSPNGAWLKGDIVRSLVGPRSPGQYAQAGVNDGGSGEPIGQVETLSGTATATRTDGTIVELVVGDFLYQGDVISTGSNSKLDIVLIDETVFSMSADARMVLDDLVYNPGASDNSMVVSLVQGGFAFVTGQIAPAGDMKVNTPVATMGIRGTAPTVQISSDDGTVKFSLVPDPGGKVGSYILTNPDTGQVLANVVDTGSYLRFESVEGDFQTFAKTADDLANDQVVQNQVAQIYNQVQQRVTTGQSVFTQNSAGSNSGPGGDPNSPDNSNNNENGDEVPAIEGESLNTNTGGMNGNQNNGDGEGGEGSSAAPKVNSPPTADPINGTVNEDGPVFNTDLLTAAHAADFDGDLLRVTDPDSIVSTTGARLLTLGVDYTIVGSTFTLTASGFDKFNSLGEGEIDTFIFNYTVFDDQEYKPGDGVEKTVNPLTIVVTGSNDTPLIQAVDVDGAITEGSILSDSGSVTFTDVDLTDRPVATEITKSITALAQNGITPLPLTPSQQAAIEAAFTIANTPGNTNNGTVTWDYTISEANLDFLGEGEKVTATFTIIVTDDEGAVAQNDVTVVITSSNDTPLIQVVDAGGSITEGSVLSDTGSVTFTDVDLTDGPVATEVTKSVTAVDQDNITPIVLTASQQAAIEAAFTIANAAGNTNNGTVTWDYTISEAKLDFLGTGDKVTATFTVIVTDDESVVADEDVTVIIIGTNDAPVITAGGALNYTENDAATVIDTSFTTSDVDDSHIESTTIEITTGYQIGEDVLGFVNQNGITGNFNAITAMLTLTGSATLAQYQTALASVTYENSSDDPSTSTRTVTTIINDGEAISIPATSIINVEAVNDAPVIAGVTSAATVDEDTTLNITNLSVSDVDTGIDPILVTFSVTNGDLAFSGATTGLSFTDADGSDGSLAFSGSASAINTALGIGLQYIP